jgi:hypothetical protein
MTYSIRTASQFASARIPARPPVDQNIVGPFYRRLLGYERRDGVGDADRRHQSNLRRVSRRQFGAENNRKIKIA